MNYKKFLSLINENYQKGTTDDKIECIVDLIKTLVTGTDIQNDVHCINKLREGIHNLSPFKNEPVDFVKWVMAENVIANDYNPNKVAPPEMELLEVSIMNDGYTQPVVTFPNNGKIEVVDGFHRTRVSKESKIVRERVKGYTPTVIIRKEQSDKNDRIASTIRHNRARGKHQVDAMSEIVLELKNRNWKNERIARELGMDEEEILRLCQITGLQDIFKDDDFSRSWESSDSIHNYEPLTDEISEEEAEHYRTVNTNDPTRIFHTFDKWECHKAGFYASSKDGMTADECEKSYAEFLSDDERFREALDGVIRDWVNSCEHYLTNKAMNRIEWLGQAAMCYATGIPSKFCSGFNLLTGQQQDKANATALEALNYWMKKYNMEEVSMEDALSIGRQVNIY
jgi:ParB-like chromosome segregation protein Spo0J